MGGVDVREIAKNDLMEQIAFVFQNTRLFNDTLLENIRASRPDATREEVMRMTEYIIPLFIHTRYCCSVKRELIYIL